MDSQKTHHATSTYRQAIEVLLQQGFNQKEAGQVFLDCGQDLIKASDKLHTKREFNPKVLSHFDGLTTGTPSGMTLMGLGNDFNFLGNFHEENELERQVS